MHRRGRDHDIRNPLKPKVLANIEDTNFAFWHSATISNDGKKVLFTDELGGGGQPTCNPTVGPNRGADAIYDITDPANPRFLSYFKIPRTQTNTENCVAHNGNLIPNNKGRDLLVQSWYQGGLSVIDWTNGEKPKEIAWFDRGPIDETRSSSAATGRPTSTTAASTAPRSSAASTSTSSTGVKDGQALHGHAERPDAGSARATEAQARPSASSVPRASPAASISARSVASITRMRSIMRLPNGSSRVGADDRVQRHAGLPRAGADLADELALQRLLVELALAGDDGAGGAHAARRSRARRAPTAAPGSSTAPCTAHSPPESPPAQPVIGTPRGSRGQPRGELVEPRLEPGDHVRRRRPSAGRTPSARPRTACGRRTARRGARRRGRRASSIASSAPAPPSVVAEPPTATRITCAPACAAAAISSPVP